ncbi:MAG: DUF1614 domain-containing protein [SAR86 cluster bacterium]
MNNHTNPSIIALLILSLVGLLLVIQFGIITVTFEKLGVSPTGATRLLLGSMIGSLINLPLFSLKTDIPRQETDSWHYLFLGLSPRQDFSRTIIAINVGGGVIPVAFSLYLFIALDLHIADVMFVGGIVALVSYLFSRPVKGMGIMMPILVAPLAAALAAMMINQPQSAPLAYIGGTLGVLVGADLLRIMDVRQLRAPIASIGGAGTFDGVFLTGIIAVLLTG